jgi:hypothetical protein
VKQRRVFPAGRRLSLKVATRLDVQDELRKRIARDIEATRAQATARGIAVDEPVEPTGEREGLSASEPFRI